MSANRKINFSKDYYDTLGVPQGASIKQIKKSYREKMLKVHPDRHRQNGINRLTAHKMAIELNEAYAVLINKDSRAEYDSGYSQNQDERRRAAEEERLREEEERRRENEQRIRAEEQRKREDETRIQAEEKRRRDEEAERERVRLERERRIAEAKREKAEYELRRMNEYLRGLAISFTCSIISGIYAFLLLKLFSEMTFMRIVFTSATISAFLMGIDYLLYLKIKITGEDVPLSMWVWGLEEKIFMPSTAATFFLCFFLYYPIIFCMSVVVLGISGVGIPGIFVVALGYIALMFFYIFNIALTIILPVEKLYTKSSFYSKIENLVESH